MTARDGGFRPLTTVTARWSQEDGSGTEHLTLEQHGERITATAVITSVRGEKPFAAWYQIFLDSRWQVKAVSVHRTDSRWFIARSPEPGQWCDGDGLEMKNLAGCRDVLLQNSRFNLTPIIRRLRLAARDASEMDVMSVAIDTLVPKRMRQRISCLEPARLYQLEDLSTGYTSNIEVDSGGLALMDAADGVRIF